MVECGEVRMGPMGYEGCRNCEFQIEPLRTCKWAENGGGGAFHLICPRGEKRGHRTVLTEILSPAEFATRMRQIAEIYRYDEEAVHVAMDNLMCDLIKSLGYGEGVEVFDNTYKYYA